MAANETAKGFVSVISGAKPLTSPADTADVLGWLVDKEAGEEVARDAGLRCLLATTGGAVVWGRKEKGGWLLSTGNALPAAELLEMRAFGPDAEVFVWRDESGLRARRRVDGQGEKAFDTFEETQLLWGTARDTATTVPDGFTPLYDGDQGLRHAPPLALDETYFVRDEKDKQYGHRPARLLLRHYIDRNDTTGVARIVDTRLVKVESMRPQEA